LEDRKIWKETFHLIFFRIKIFLLLILFLFLKIPEKTVHRRWCLFRRL
jgi:hypothetical protein